jgi:hypothetical protein
MNKGRTKSDRVSVKMNERITTYRQRGNILAIAIWVVQEGMEAETIGSRRLDFDVNGKRDALLGIDNDRIQD